MLTMTIGAFGPEGIYSKTAWFEQLTIPFLFVQDYKPCVESDKMKDWQQRMGLSHCNSLLKNTPVAQSYCPYLAFD